jgi:hypothetical protein
MSENSEPTTQPVTPPVDRPAVAPVTEVRDRRPSRAVQAAAWVGIVAGTVFVVAVIFFSGFILGKQADGGGRGFGPDGPRHHHEMMFDEARPGPPMFRPGPGENGPGPGNAGPAQQPPAPPSPPARP